MTRRRYLFYGRLVTETGLHVGSGQGDVRTDATVIKGSDRQPLIPGSSLKGALRSRVEGLVASLPPELGLRSCRLDPSAQGVCATTDKNWQKEYGDKLERGAQEDELDSFLLGQGLDGVTLCHTCRLFGSPYRASRVLLRDAPLVGELEGPTEVRHGVGIDRETGTARERIKFDYEVVPSQTAFRFELVLEEPQGHDLPLLAIGLREMELGAVSLGGNSSRGLGSCRLELERIFLVDYGDAKSLLTYLVGSESERRESSQEWIGPKATEWLNGQIRELLAREGDDAGHDS